ncbi:hypothetical protein [Streptomyces sp. NPDC004232]|uniref:hypothetical protein n=1 Tax=unclassified Streptomyces TaxID=2593676 RepID=UPI001E0DAF53|nr:hypothetical protein [Streptomyces sp. tea 10]
MGVFARIFGRSKATPETPDAVAQAGVEPDGAEAEEVESAAAEETASAEAKGTTGDGCEDASARSGAGADETSDGSGIPKQQSAEEAADSATGEGARR